MLLGHYWQYLGQHKGAEFSNIKLPKYEVTQINYPYLSFENSYEEFAYSLFASQLVMPARAVSTRLRLSDKQPSLIKVIKSASDFKVPVDVMMHRIELLNLNNGKAMFSTLLKRLPNIWSCHDKY